MPKPRTKPAEQRRIELMDAAQRLFLEHGLEATTIDQITSRAGVAKGTFYLHFSSKEDIRAALEDRFAADLLGRIRSAVSREGDWKGKLASWAAAGVDGYLDSIRLHDILFYGSRPASREDLGSNIVLEDLVELLQAGARAGAWELDDPRFTAVFLFSGLHGVVDEAHLRDKRVNRTRLTQRVQRICFRAVSV